MKNITIEAETVTATAGAAPEGGCGGKKMKSTISLLISLVMISGSASLFAGQNEKIRQDSGVRFGVTPTDKRIGSSPVKLDYVPRPAQTIDPSELSVSKGVGKNTPPPRPESGQAAEPEKKRGKTPEIIGAAVGGTAVVGTALYVAAVTTAFSGAMAVAPVVVAAAAGAAVGYGIVAGGRWLYENVSISVGGKN